MDLVGAEGPVTEEELQRLEQRLSVEIPQELRQHYLRVNGGTPVPNAFVIGEDYYKVQEFLRVDEGDDNGVEATFTDISSNDIYPSGFIPFAVDSSGDYFLCSLSESPGSIFFYQSDYYDDPERALVFLAPSFSNFIAQLQYDDS
jgi:hypothetical protein